MADTPQDVVNRELREFRRYTGDGLPGEPVNAPLPVGDPQSGVHNPKKVNLRKALMAPVEAAAQSASDAKDEADRAGEEADRSDAAADRAENSASSFIEVATNFKTVATLLADETMGYAGSGKAVIVAPGDIITAQGFRYEVAASDAMDWHVETAGGVKLRVSPDNPFLRPEMFAAFGSENDEMPALQLAIDTAASYSRWLEMSKVHWIKVLDYPYTDGDPYRNGLDVPSGSRIRFVGDGEIKVLPCYTQHLQILNLFECEDVEIISPKLDGKKQDNSFDPSIVGSNQMFCMGIAMRAAKRVRVVAPNISDCRGDGIFMWRPLGALEAAFCEDIEVVSPRIDGCSRQGISVSSVRTCRISDPHISNIGPIAPGAGIDIEPESELDIIQGLVIDNARTKNCAYGIMTYFAHLTEDSAPVDVVINDHFDEGSNTAFQPGQIRPGSKGAVHYNRGIGYRSAGPVTFFAREHAADGVKTIMRDCTAITQGDDAVGFRLEPFLNDPRDWPIGNIELEGLTCYADDDEPLPLRGIHIRSHTHKQDSLGWRLLIH